MNWLTYLYLFAVSFAISHTLFSSIFIRLAWKLNLVLMTMCGVSSHCYARHVVMYSYLQSTNEMTINNAASQYHKQKSTCLEMKKGNKMASFSHRHFFHLTFATSVQLPIEYTDAAVLELHGTVDSLFFPILHYLGRLWINSTQLSEHLQMQVQNTSMSA